MSFELLHEGPGSCDIGRRAVRETVVSGGIQCRNGCSEEKKGGLGWCTHCTPKNQNPRRDEMQNRCVGPLMYFHPTVKTESVNVSPD